MVLRPDEALATNSQISDTRDSYRTMGNERCQFFNRNLAVEQSAKDLESSFVSWKNTGNLIPWYCRYAVIIMSLSIHGSGGDGGVGNQRELVSLNGPIV